MNGVGDEVPAPSDRVVSDDELTPADRSALGWAVSTGHPLGGAIIARVRRGGSGATVGELAAIHRDWEAAGRPASQHHRHRTRVVLADGTPITGVTFVSEDPYTREVQPAFGLYLDERWQPPWPHALLHWPDFGVPTHISGLRAALVDLLARARRGETVELGCLGGHGRTGTALACLAVLTGVPAAEAVAWVRRSYCAKAVETDSQEAFVLEFEG